MSSRSLKIAFHSMDGAGHLNACLGLAQALAKRNHQIIFLLNSANAGKFSKYGFDEYLLKEATKPKSEDISSPEEEKQENPVKKFAKMILESGMLNSKSSIEKLKDDAGMKQFSTVLVHTVTAFEPQIEQALQLKKPDLIILDHFFVPPSILRSKIPWINLLSGNPLFPLNSPNLPPGGSGYPTDGDRSKWEEFRCLQAKHFGTLWMESQRKLCEKFDVVLTPENDPFIESNTFPRSPYLNIYGYPAELDYQDIEPLKDNFASVDTFCREIAEPFNLPESFVSKQTGSDKMIYFSMGSMGTIDIELVQRVCRVLAKTPYKCIVSKGPLADEYHLPDNCWGEAFLSQTQILPLVDLVITHGGNNTTTESFSFGKPMIVLPLFGDQYDNAQRITEKGFGVRFEPYSFDDDELLAAINRLINDDQLKQRMEKIAKRIADSNSKEKVCIRIEQLVDQNI
ncbi:hypothetical protein RDWZM_002464 [Blomia tropicalis]|uniref:UDP-glucuronosyltransferase n=1 Tax=Blomia tropicalis TaxID=40697 RepID=A0A9Q0MDU9_BLOTA|nr:hypothetical protein RDWZM_002464 [Blomia tropicalis]